jgi:LPXTG-motif cell wall-anchored protein
MTKSVRPPEDHMARWLRRGVTLGVLTLALSLFIATPQAYADETVAPANGELPATAAPGCTGWQGPGDLWRFAVVNGTLVSATLTFAAPGLTTHVRSLGPEGEITTEPGWILVDATATVTDAKNPSFDLIQACAAEELPALGPAEANKSQQLTTLPLTGTTDIAATMTLGSTIVVAGMLLLIVRRRPRGKHRAPKGYEPDEDVRQPVIQRG